MDITCSHCGKSQPFDFDRPLCSQCGQPLRLERLCPWCLEASPAGNFCRACGCELAPPELFGAARMLKAAGVDRFSLGERLRKLHPAQLQTLQLAYEKQRSVVLAIAEQARFCEGFLVQKVFSEPLEKSLIARLPLQDDELEKLGRGPRPPFTEKEQLSEILTLSPLEEIRCLAALALLRLGENKREIIQPACAALGENGPLALEAALALCHWRQFLLSPWREHGRKVYQILGKVLSHQTLGRPAAAALALLIVGGYGSIRRLAEDPHWPQLEPLLKAGLTDSDGDLAFSCALALGQRPQLLSALSGDDAQTAQAARMVLLQLGEALEAVLESLRQADEKTCLSWLRHLPLPLPPVQIKMLLDEFRNASEHFYCELFRFLRQRPAAEYQPEALSLLDDFARRPQVQKLAMEDLLEQLAWAAQPVDKTGSGPKSIRLEATGGWLQACTCALRNLEFSRLRQLHGEGLLFWLWQAKGPEMEAVLDSWASRPESCRWLLERLCTLDSLADRLDYAGLAPAWRILFGLWERCPARELPRLARDIASSWSWSYRQDEEGARKALEERYRHFPDERPLLLVAFSSLLQRRGEKPLEFHRRLAAGQAPGGEDPLRTWRLLLAADPQSLYEHITWVCQELSPEKAAPLAEAIFAELAGRADGPTRLFPPAVAFARWLEENAAAFSPEQLEKTSRALQEGWEKIVARTAPCPDETDEYYRREKIEEVAGILERLRKRRLS